MKRTQILHELLEGVSLRAISRIEEVSVSTITRLLVDTGNACAEFRNETVRDVRLKRVQADEIWAFSHAKQSNVKWRSGSAAACSSPGTAWRPT